MTAATKGVVDESGYFFIVWRRRSTVDYYMHNYHRRSLTYKEAAEIAEALGRENTENQYIIVKMVANVQKVIVREEYKAVLL